METSPSAGATDCVVLAAAGVKKAPVLHLFLVLSQVVPVLACSALFSGENVMC